MITKGLYVHFEYVHFVHSKPQWQNALNSNDTMSRDTFASRSIYSPVVLPSQQETAQILSAMAQTS